MSRELATKRPITLGQCLRPVPAEVITRAFNLAAMLFHILAPHHTNGLRFWGRRWPDNSSWCQARYSLMRFRLQIPAAATRCNLWLMWYAATLSRDEPTELCIEARQGHLRCPTSELVWQSPPISAEINATIPASGVTATGYVITEFRADGKVSIWLPRLRSSPTPQIGRASCRERV